MAPAASDSGHLDEAASRVATIVLGSHELGLAVAGLVGLWVLAFALGVLAARGTRDVRETPFDVPLPARPGASWVRVIVPGEVKDGTRSDAP